MKLFARITKMDANTRRVHGTLVQEVRDRSGEIFDYETSKAHFAAWSDGIHKATEGKSVGNMRAMHGNVVAGKFVDIVFDDANKSIDVVGEVVDDNEWKKCESGCYTGFSIGGRYANKWADTQDPTAKRYTAIPSEGSLVDLPCVPTAQFKMVKADGSDELRKFHIDNTPVAKRLLLQDVAQQSARILKSLAGALDIDVVTGLDEANVIKILDAASGDLPEGLEDVVKSLSTSLLDYSTRELPDAAEEIHKSTAAALAKATTDMDALNKTHGETVEALAKATGDLTKATGERDTALAKVAAQTIEIEELKKKAATPPGIARVISKGADAGGDNTPSNVNDIVVKNADGSVNGLATAMEQIRGLSSGVGFNQK